MVSNLKASLRCQGEELKKNVLPLQGDVIFHYQHLKNKLKETDANFLRKDPSFKDVKLSLAEDVAKVWIRASLPILSYCRIETKLKELVEKWKAAVKRARRKEEDTVTEAWTKELLDICSCKCTIAAEQVFRGRALCSCPFESRVNSLEISFLLDQRSERKMFIGWSRDKHFEKSVQEKLKRKRKCATVESCEPSTSGLSQCSGESDANSDSEEIQSIFSPPEKLVTGGKHYLRTKTQFITDSSCILADRRMTSIRQQADQIRECGGSEIAASPSTVFRKRQKVRSTALSNSLKELRSANAIQLCYDGRFDIKNKVERYVLLGEFNNGQLRSEQVIAVKSFISGTSVTSDVLFNAIIDNCGDLLQNVYSVMADTTAINTGKKSGVNKRLEQYFTQHMGRDIHVLECLFHVNEIYFNHMIKAIEGKKKGPGALEEGSLRNRINNLGKPDSTHVISRNELPFVSITTIAKTHLKANLEWFLDQKKNKMDDLRNDQMCLLILTCSLFMDVPDQLQPLLFYKQETTCHSRWITTASGYIRLFLFQGHDLSAGDMDNLNEFCLT